MLRFIFIVCVCANFGKGVNAQEATTITVGFADFAPFSYLNDQGQPAGDFLARVGSAVQAAGYRFEPKVFPAKRGFASIKSGTIDVFLCLGRANVGILGDSVSYSDVPLGTLYLRVYGLMKSPVVLQRQDLLGHNLVFRRGYSYGGLRAWLERNKGKMNYIDSNTTLQGLRLVQAGRSDYFLEYQFAVDYLAQQTQLSPPPSTELSRVATYLVFARHLDGMPVQQRVEAALKQINR